MSSENISDKPYPLDTLKATLQEAGKKIVNGIALSIVEDGVFDTQYVEDWLYERINELRRDDMDAMLLPSELKYEHVMKSKHNVSIRMDQRIVMGRRLSCTRLEKSQQ